MRHITAREAREQFDSLLDAAAGEPVAITRDGRTAAVLVPAEAYAAVQKAARQRLPKTIDSMQRHAEDAGLTEEVLEDILKNES